MNDGINNQMMNEVDLNEGMDEHENMDGEMERGMNDYMGIQIGEEEMGEGGVDVENMDLGDMNMNYNNEEHDNNDINKLGDF